jgi:hypothetical protein
MAQFPALPGFQHAMTSFVLPLTVVTLAILAAVAFRPQKAPVR